MPSQEVPHDSFSWALDASWDGSTTGWGNASRNRVMRQGGPVPLVGKFRTTSPRFKYRSGGGQDHRPKPSTSYHRWPIGERCRRIQFASQARKIRYQVCCRCDIAGSKGLKLSCIFMSDTHGARLGHLAADRRESCCCDRAWNAMRSLCCETLATQSTQLCR